MFYGKADVNCFFRVGVEEEVEMIPYASVRNVSIILSIVDE
jgi:hypothetical protein